MKKVITVLVVIGILLAFPVSSFAIGFDAEEIYNSVFVITAGNSIGSGFSIGKNVIITNHHVIEDSRRVYVETYDGETYPAEIYASDKRLDIAVLTVKNGNFIPLKIADESTMKIGDDIYTIGAPNSLAYTLTKGVISTKERVVEGQKYIQIDAAINKGNSGGPLLTDAGEVLGINTMKISDAEGIGLSIPISVAVDYLKKCGITFDSENTANVTEPATDTGVTEQGATEQGVIQDDSPENPTDRKPVIRDEKESMKKFYTNLTVIAALVVAAIVVVIVLYKKNSGKYVTKADPSERTDFEIEIEE